MSAYIQWILIANYAAVPFFVGSVLLRRREPAAMLAWIFAIVTMPVVGITLYVLFGETRVRTKAGRRRRRIAHLTAQLERWAERQAKPGEDRSLAELPPDLNAVAQLGRRLVDMPAVGGNKVDIYDEPNATFAALESAIRGAQRHVHLEYYIWQPDATGLHFRDLVIEKARGGVQCRLLLDSVGSWKVNRRFTQPLLDAGVEVAFYLPLYRRRKRVTIHLRNHRKIAVIDGRVAFVGSQNIGDEYRGWRKALSPWRDTHMRVEGPAALFLQQIFAEDWSFATQAQLNLADLYAEPRPAGDSIVQILPTGPDQDVAALTQVVFAAVSMARSAIRIEVPYFVPDPGLIMALQYARYRGVRVQIVLPTRTDAPLALWAGRSFYKELLDAGVEVFEYDAGVLHSKLITVDDRWCMVGSANMDVRSFRLNFEVTALVYDAAVAAQLSESVERHCGQARPITARDVWNRRLSAELIDGAARLFAPLL